MWSRPRPAGAKTRHAPARLTVETLEDRAVPAAFTPGNLVILRVGDGGTTLSSSAIGGALVELTTGGANPSGGANAINLPAFASNNAGGLTFSGSATTNGGLTLSPDGHYLALIGYDAALGTATVTSSASSTIARNVARIGNNAAITIVGRLTDAYSGSGANARAAVTPDGATFYISGTGTGDGARYFTYSGSAATTSTQIASGNFRQADIVNGNLVYDTQTTINRFSGLPTATASATGLGITLSDAGEFVFLDRQAGVGDPSLGGVDTLYVANNNAANAIAKYYWNSVTSAWTAAGLAALAAGSLFGLVGQVNGSGGVDLYATTNGTSNNSLLKFTDTAAYNANMSSGSFTTLATAGPNYLFRGVAFAPGNYAPALSGANDFTAINEDVPSTSNPGTLVSSLISGKVTDFNAGDPQGIAVTALGGTSSGTWQYTTNGGTNWTDVGTVSDAQALLLKSDANTRLRFVPNADFNGTISPGVTFRAWDQFTGTAGNKVSVSTNGGGTAFSSSTASASITVDPVNDAPTLSATAVNPTFTENGTAADLFKPTISVSTAEAGQAITRFTLTVSNVSDGASEILRVDGTDVALTDGNSVTTSANALAVGVTLSGSTAMVTVGKATGISSSTAISVIDGLAYRNASDDPAAGSRVVTLTSITDSGGTDNGGVDTTSVSIASTVAVVPVNDPPSGADSTVTTAEDTPYTFTANDFGFTDSLDGDDFAGVLIVAPPATGSLTNNGITVAADDFVSAADIAAGLLVFTPDADGNGDGYAGFTFRVRDDGGTDHGGADTDPVDRTMTIDVTPVNDPPSFTLGTDPVVDEDAGAQSISGFASSIQPGPATATDEAAQTLTFDLTNDNNGLFGSQPAIDSSGNLTFTPAANASGTAKVTVKLTDGGSNTPPNVNNFTKTFTITVNSVADAPSVTAATTDEDVRTTSGLLVTRSADDDTDVTHFQVTGITGGTLYRADGSTVVSEGEFIEFAANGTYQLYFLPDPDQNDDTSTFGFNVQASLGGFNAGLGGDVVPVSISVNAVNDAPTFSLGTDPTVDEDAGAQTVSGFASNFQAGPSTATDELATQTVAQYNVTVIGTTGNLAFTSGPGIDASGNLTFTTAADTNGTATVQITLADSGSGSSPNVNTSAAQTFTITVNAVNDAPTFTLGSDPVVDEDAGAQTVSGFASNFQPGPATATDEASQTLIQYTVTVLGTTGTLVFTSGPAIDSSGNLTFTTAIDTNGTATVQVTATDSGDGTSPNVNTSAPQTFTITVNAVNDAPSFTTTGDVTIDEDAGAQTVGGFAKFQPGPTTATDEAAQTATYTITVMGTTGTLAFASSPSIDASGNLTFTVAADTNGAATIQVSVADSGDGTAPNVNTSAAQTFTITVNAVNDAPGFTLAGNVLVSQGSGMTTLVNFATFSPGGGADEATQTPTYTLVPTKPGFFSAPPAVDSAGNLTFTLKPGVSGATTVFVTAQDDGGTAHGGTDASLPQQFTLTITPAPPPPPVLVGDSAQIIAVGSDVGGPSHVRVLDPRTGAVLSEFAPFGPFAGGVRVAVGDVNGDKVDDVIVATATGSSHVKVFTAAGAEVLSFLAFPGYTGGVTLAAGDVNGDGREDIIAGTLSGTTHVKVFSGPAGVLIQSFLAFGGFGGGVRVAAGDVNGDGRADIAAVAGPGGNGHVKVFDGPTNQLVASFLSYEGYSGEINLAVGDLTGDGRAEIITAAQNPQFGTHVKAFTSQAQIVRSFFAPASIGAMAGFPDQEAFGIVPNQARRVASADVTGDNIADLLLGDPPGRGLSQLVIVNGATGAVIQDLVAFDPLFAFGVFVDM